MATNNVDTIYYTYTDNHGCSAKVTDSIRPTFCDGIESISSNPIYLYPNPSRGSFTLQTHLLEGEVYTIIDMLGNTIEQKQITSDTQAIDLREAEEGVYTLMVKGSQPVRFVIMR
jgi:hypothetical protein